MSLVSPLLDAAIELLRADEGVMKFMYTDTAHVVTVGVGHALFAKGDAQGLPFFNSDGTACTTDEIGAGWDWLKARPPSKTTTYKYTAISMEDSDINSLLGSDLEKYYDVLIKTFSAAFDTYPDNAKLALLDMAFNLGSLVHYPKLVAAVKVENWNTAAAESHRNGIGDDRNLKTQQLFLSCV